MKNKAVMLPTLALAFICTAQVISGQGTRLNVPGDYATIQAAVDAANEGDTVLVSDGTYYENIRIYSKSFVLASEYILDGDEEHIKNTILDGSDPVLADSASVILIRNCLGSGPLIKGFTITGGGGTKVVPPRFGTFRGGGGICANLSGITIDNNIITGNEISDPVFEADGGGILAVTLVPEMQVIIRNNRVYDNSVQSPIYAQGAGIYIAGSFGSKLVENNDIFENTATCTGEWKANAGGIQLHTQDPWATPIIIRNNRISKNEIHCVASQGGGIFLSFPPWGETDTWGGKSQIEIYNNLIVDNYSEDRGGGIAIWDQTGEAIGISDPNPLIYNNTIVNNIATQGGALFNFRMKPLLFNNIFWNMAGIGSICEISMENTEYPNREKTNFGKVLCQYNDIKCGYTGETNIDLEPCWLPESYTPDSLSKCIGRGIDTLEINGIVYAAPSTDYYGNPRPNPVDSLVDMGAIESSFKITEIESSTFKGDIMRPDKHAFQVFPNPAKDHVILLADQYGKYTLELYTSNGQLVKRKEINGSSCSVDLASCQEGLYILLIRTQDEVWTWKIVRQ